MRVVEKVRDMQGWADAARRAGERIGLVPTMGYLHAGHLSLVREARRLSDRQVTSIFVNPMQFGPNEDLDRYPRDLARDRERLAALDVDVLFLPPAEEMYPPGYQTEVRVREMTQGLCGRSRPVHFLGVTTIVTKLFHAVKPHVAVFGCKDYQQLATIRRLVIDLNLDVEVVGSPTVREEDGLAMSSRNAYLTPEERRAAPCLFRALELAARLVAAGECRAEVLLEQVRAGIEEEPLARLDYAELVDPDSLQPVRKIAPRALLALAVSFGKARLIDNRMLTVPDAAGTGAGAAQVYAADAR